ncbi:TSUP family transporter [Moraxella oblonga]|uniref:TSUP family transporter n=1 Tax=Moraxella oblonga TaxID=200413 RepID=UPI00083031E8|nr:TSUP family transporter [Moraxella oblonga]
MLNDLILGIINFFTSTLAGITGLGGGTILLGLMPMFLPASAIIPIHGTTQLASNISRVWFGRQELDFTYFRPFVVGAVVGVVFFGTAVKFVQLDLIPLFIAIYILLTQWSKTINRLLKSLENFYLIGFLQTGIGLFVGAPGPLHMPLLMKKYDNNDVVVTVGSLMMTLIHVLKLTVYVILGFAFFEYWQVILFMVVSASLGSWAGVKLRNRLPMNWVKTALPYILTIIALKIIYDNAVKFGWIAF